MRTQRRRRRSSQGLDDRVKLAREIKALEKRLSGYGMMTEEDFMEDELLEDEILDDELEDELLDDELEDELLDDELEDELLDDELEDELLDDELDDDYMEEEDIDYCLASESDPSGVEEEIDQDYLSEVERLRGDEDLADEDSVLAVAPTKSEYVQKLSSAAKRLDRVATYLEKGGRVKLAYRIDKISDVIENRIKRISK